MPPPPAPISRRFRPRPRTRRYGRGPVEVLVVAGLVGFAAVLVLMALPRSRETSRLATCQNNLRQIGVGLQMYHQASRHYPTVPRPDSPGGDAPIAAMLDTLAIPDLLELRDPAHPPKATQRPPRGLRLPGLTCPSDPNAMARRSLPMISYRANTGDDPRGLGGPFQPGRVLSSAAIEAADGLGFTAGFAERLTGDGRDGQPAPWNYATSPVEVDRGGCKDAPADRWRGDAGSDWAEASWRSTLYNHVLPPNAAPSCLADDGRSALMGASSGHVKQINVLMMDGSLRVVTPTIDPRIWGGLGTVEPPASKPAP